jgi:PAS domain S-box-containing protein
MILKSEAEFRIISEKANDGIITVDEDYAIIFTNKAIEHIFGYKKDEIINNSLLKLFSFEQHIDLLKKFKELKDEYGIIIESIAIKNNRKKFPVEVSLSINKYDNYITYTIIVRDITTRKDLELQLKEYTEKLEELVEIRTNELIEQNIALDDANKQLKKLDELKSSFLSNVSHELRTPLTSIKSSAKIINKYGLKKPDSINKFSGIIIEEVDRLTRLINNVLDLSKIEAGEMTFNFKKINFYDLLHHIYVITSPSVFDKKLKYLVSIPDKIPNIVVDKDSIIQVIVNLISNAVKFTDFGYIKISVILNSDSTKIKFLIEDSGVGIIKEDLSNVFDKFKQSGDTLTDKPKGTGLGLPISKEIIHHHGGAIWVESEIGKGSKFIFTLPISK